MRHGCRERAYVSRWFTPPLERWAALFKDFVQVSGRYAVDLTEERDALCAENIGKCGAVVLYAAERGESARPQLDGLFVDGQVRYGQSAWQVGYQNVADHLLVGDPLALTPESGRRVISVIETPEESFKHRKSMALLAHRA